jgi:hypothetical protein
MKEPVDNLINKIHEVFETYQDDSAEYGWAEFQKLQEKGNKKRPLIFWLSSAAALLFLAGLWVFIADTSKSPTTIVKNKPAVSAKPTTADSVSQNPAVAATNKPASPIKAVDKNSAATVSHQATNSIVSINVSRGNKANYSPKINVKTGQANNSSPTTKSLTNERQLISNSVIPPFRSKVTGTLDSSAFKNRAEGTNLSQIITSVVPKSDISVQVVSGDNATKVNEPSLIVRDAEKLSKLLQNNSKTPEVVGKKFGLSVYAGTHMNYAKGSENGLNLGFGLSSDIKISRRLKISTGVAIAQNTLKYANTHNVSSETYSQFASLLNGALDSYAGVAADVGFSSKYPNASGAMAMPQNLDANLLSIDIPVNIKYQLSAKRNKAYILTGFSSGTYLNEVYNYRYNNSYQLGNKVVLDSQNKDFSVKGSNNFYFARTLNISAGISTPLSKNQDLVIEPFLKYPLGGLGEQQIRFGAAGLNLKLNFNNVKK